MLWRRDFCPLDRKLGLGAFGEDLGEVLNWGQGLQSCGVGHQHWR